VAAPVFVEDDRSGSTEIHVRFLAERVLVAAAFAVAGCANIPADRGYGDVRRQVADRGVELTDASGAERSTLVGEILASPLTPDAAVRVAFVNNPRQQMEYARLGLSGAEVIQAGRLSNPTLAASWQTSSRTSDSSRYDFGLTQNFSELLLLGARTRFSEGEFERAKLDATQRLLDLAARVQAAYYDVVGARQVAQMRSAVASAANASAELAARFKDAGNINALELAIEQAAASQASLDHERAEAEAASAASVLNELMGLDPGAQWQTASALPMPVAAEDPIDELQQLAQQQRADLDSNRRAVVLLEDALGLARSYRYLGEVQVGAQYERDTDGSRLIGPSLSLQLPVFNQGQAAILRAQALLDAARADVRAKELEISNAVQAANDRVMAARQRIHRIANETIPLREQIVARSQEQTNYMLLGVFELLRAKQDEYTTYQQYLEAVRDYWRARVELAHAVGGRLPSDQSSPIPDAAPAAAAGTSIGPDHNHHGE
jgi:cobalt-zinc-cadmium efflux system outer membrane protein